ncbi:CHAT domain-containing protein [Scytonema hofmannii FACHB-248]|uniref:CHAT domain-containing protein n=1 Tax=Scytonema hofmannii FACHB-248 TaxID=1842502 RepID=A0ABR8H244_9CYAN|nr:MULTISPECIES: CHAT domain-containing protein [Nostocales]MBD2609073.1 CHAT domain-containing protein [Scytonema hofmannii FACHB-248]
MSNNPTVKKILILAANPKNTVRLRLDQEVHDIKKGLQSAKERDNFILQQEGAVRPQDIRLAVLDFRPNIIHFSGHGSETEGLSFEDEVGKEKFVTAEALAEFFKLFAKDVECVLLNACYSEVQAKAIAQHIDYVIGMNEAIADKAALEFAVGFYDALARYNPQSDGDSSIEFAFNVARSSILLAGVSGASIPVLIKNPNLKPKDTTILKRMNPTIIRYSGKAKNYICQRLVDDWEQLADHFDIPKHQKNSFERGKEPNRVWEWLEQRSRLGELEVALSDIGRDDLVEELKKN